MVLPESAARSETAWEGLFRLRWFFIASGDPVSSAVAAVRTIWLCGRDTGALSSASYRFFFFFFFFLQFPPWARASSFMRFLDHTQRRSTVGRTPLGEWSARRRVLYLTTHNTHNTHTSMPPVGFEPTISAGERSQTYALGRAATLQNFEFEKLFVCQLSAFNLKWWRVRPIRNPYLLLLINTSQINMPK